MPTKPLSEELGVLEKRDIGSGYTLVFWDNGGVSLRYKDGSSWSDNARAIGHLVGKISNLEGKLAKAFKAGQTELAQKVLEEVIGEFQDTTALGNGEDTLKAMGANELRLEQRTKLAQLVEKEGK